MQRGRGEKGSPHGSHAPGWLYERQVNETFGGGSIGTLQKEDKAGGRIPRPAERQMKVLRIMSQLMLTALFALSISFLTFAASFAEVPRSDFVPSASIAQH